MFTTIEITLLALIFACVIVSACFWFLYMHELNRHNKHKNNRTYFYQMILASAVDLIVDTEYGEARGLLNKVLQYGSEAEAKRAQSLLNDISWRQMQFIHETQNIDLATVNKQYKAQI